MIDMHSHILPGVDDGAQILDDSLRLLDVAIDNGVKVQYCTPHIHIGRYNNNRSQLEASFQKFNDIIKVKKPEIELRLGSEVRIGPEVLPLIKQGQVLWLGKWQGKDVMLMEFPHNMIPAGSINVVQWLMKEGIQPLIAHPERNRGIQEQPSKLKEFIDAGCLLQVTSGSLLGNFGPEAKSISLKLLSEKLITLLATDCHNIEYRPPNLAAGFNFVRKIMGEAEARALVQDTPQMIMDG